MPGFTNRIAALRELSTELDTFAAKVTETMGAAQKAIQSGGDSIIKEVDRVASDVDPRLQDLKATLEQSVADGNDWSKGLLDLIRQVEQGTIRADQAMAKLGDGMINFEGRFQNIDDLLLQFLPTSGQVQERLRELQQQLKEADIGSLIDHLNEQYNVYATELAKAVEAYKAGKGSLERIAQLAQQINERLPGSETDTLAQEIRDRLLGGLL